MLGFSMLPRVLLHLEWDDQLARGRERRDGEKLEKERDKWRDRQTESEIEKERDIEKDREKGQERE